MDSVRLLAVVFVVIGIGLALLSTMPRSKKMPRNQSSRSARHHPPEHR
jgi:hypothetical protein